VPTVYPLFARLAEAPLCLAGVAQTPPPAVPQPGFWAQRGDAILVAVITAVLILLFQEAARALLRKLGQGFARLSSRLGWRFRRRYLEALPNEHRWLRLIGIYNRADLHPPRLREVYVSLQLAAGGAGRRARDSKLAWHEVFSGAERCVAVLGPPGSGKSTLLDYLVLVLCGEVRHPLRERLGQPCPLFARLRGLAGEGEGASVLGLLRKSVPFSRVPAGFPEDRLARGGCVVLLDGLDEVLDEERHRQAAAEVQRLVADYPDNRYLVTCRVAGWRNQLPGFRTYEIQELGDGDVRQYLGAWYREVLRTGKVNPLGPRPEPEALARAERQTYEEAAAEAGRLWEELAANESLLRIARTPLILSLITLVRHYQVAKLPKGRAQLYGRCLEVLLESWDAKDKLLRLPLSPSLKDKLLVLRAIAFHFVEAGLVEADLATLERVVEPLLPRLGVAVAAPALIEQIWQRSGILVEQALGRYGFAHRALHDHLAACHAVEAERDDLLLERAGEERWREVILLAAGLVSPARATRLIEALLEQGAPREPPTPASAAALEMAGFALAEDVQVGEDLRAEVRRRLLDALAGREAPATFGRLASALLAADLEAARAWMAEGLRGRDSDLRRRILEVLPGLGKDHGRSLQPLLGALVADPAEATALRAQAALALAKLGIAPGEEIWQALGRARRDEDYGLRAAATWAWCELGRYEELRLVKVPEGEFLMGSPEGEGMDNERPQHTLYLPTFYIGKHPVTVAELRRFFEESAGDRGDAAIPTAGPDRLDKRAWWRQVLASARRRRMGMPSEGGLDKAARQIEGIVDRSGWDEDADSLRGPSDHPVTMLSWHRALGYARWQGMSLPSEAEWEKAARGTDGRRYPWGNDWQPGRANTWEHWQGAAGLLRRRPDRWRDKRGTFRFPRGRGHTTPVGTFSPAGDSPYGCTDMAGNVWDWSRSLWGADLQKPRYAYPYQASDGREDLDAPGEVLRVVRGGSYFLGSWGVRCAARYGVRPDLRNDYFGFRVVVSPFTSEL
jgi:formylglycine-generating enzyme required for sulfatase activity